MINITKELLNIAKIFNQKTKLYIVGGHIRNCLLNIKSKDIDLCSSLTLKEVEELLKNTHFKVVKPNYSFGTCKIKGNTIYEYSTFRVDKYNEDGSHFPKKVEFCKDIKTDSARRDFTINCLYYDIMGKKIIDFYNSQKDINLKVLRAIPKAESTLKYDGDRLLRMIKFSVVYNLEIETETLYFATKYSKNINDLNDSTVLKFISEINALSKSKKTKAINLLKLLNCNQIVEKYFK